jgi:hypothetical protein
MFKGILEEIHNKRELKGLANESRIISKRVKNNHHYNLSNSEIFHIDLFLKVLFNQKRGGARVEPIEPFSLRIQSPIIFMIC